MGRSLTVEQVFFYIIAAAVISTAIGVVTVPNIVHAALLLVASLLSIAGLYVLLSAEFIALVQVLLYAGGVIILVLFALMMTRGREVRGQAIDGAQKPFAVLAGLALLGVLTSVAVSTAWRAREGDFTPVPLAAIGEALFSTWAVPFEIASLVLLVALVGAIVVARQEDE